jgi:hypothetical protein
VTKHLGIAVTLDFPDGTFGVGPLLSSIPTPSDLAQLTPYRFEFNGKEYTVFHDGTMTPAKKSIINLYSKANL